MCFKVHSQSPTCFILSEYTFPNKAVTEFLKSVNVFIRFGREGPEASVPFTTVAFATFCKAYGGGY